jgi:hypothetical protein
MEAAVGEALIKGCQQISDDLDKHTGWKKKARNKIFGDDNYYVPTTVDNNSRTISNYSSYPVTIIYPDGQVVLFPGNSQTFTNENPDRKWNDFQTSFSYRYNENLVTMEYSGDYWGVTFYDKIIDDDEDYNDVDNDERDENNGIVHSESVNNIQTNEMNNDNPVDVSLVTPGEFSNLNLSDYEQGNTNFEQTNTNIRQLVLAGSIPINLRQNSSLSHNTIAAYIMSKSPLMSRLDVERLINIYIQEAQKKGISYEIAIAQMCYASKFLKNRKLIINYDYAGINNGKSFKNMSEGVHSHIQHLYDITSAHEDSLITWARKNTLYVRNIIIILYEMNAYIE